MPVLDIGELATKKRLVFFSRFPFFKKQLAELDGKHAISVSFFVSVVVMPHEQ